MNIFMFGSDETIFSEIGANNQTIKRLALYLKIIKQTNPNTKIFYIISTRNHQQEFSINNELFLIPIQSKFIQEYPFKAYKYLSKHFSKHEPDLITCQNPFEFGILGLMINKEYHIPLEIQIHLNLFSTYWLREHPIYNRLRYQIAKVALKKANKIRVVSSNLQMNLIEKWKIDASKVFIAPVPVMIQDFSVEPSIVYQPVNHKEKNVLYVGRLVQSKNMPGLLKVYRKILSINKNIQFIIIGDGPLRRYINYQASKIDQERIHILGFIPYSQLTEWYEKSDVFILPSLHEGFSRVLVESYLFKLPAVATKCGGPQDIIIDGHTGYLINIDDIDLFSEKTIWLLEHPKEAKAMGLEGYKFVKNQFNPAVLAHKIVSEWKQLVENYETGHDCSANNIR